MKKKVIATLLLIATMLQLILNVYGTVENNPEFKNSGFDVMQNIEFSNLVEVDKNTAKIDITLSDKLEPGFKISYEKIDITREKFEKAVIETQKIREGFRNSIYSTYRYNNLEKEFIRTKKIYEELKQNNLTSPLELENAKRNYENAQAALAREPRLEEVREFWEIYKLIYLAVPQNTENWIETNNVENNATINFELSNNSNDDYFVVWIKITNGNETFYNYNTYHVERSVIEENIVTSTPILDDELEKRDWENAKFELKKSGISDAIIEVSGVPYKEGRNYYVDISAEPTYMFLLRGKIPLIYNKETNKYVSYDVNKKIAMRVEYNRDIYASVVEDVYEEGTLKYKRRVEFQKLEKYEEPKYSDAFINSEINNNSSTMTFNFTHGNLYDRKYQLKIGKVTNKKILNKIKNGEKVGFEELLNYSKETTGIFDEDIEIQKGNTLTYKASGEEPVNNIKGLENGEYYFVYVKANDNRGVKLVDSRTNEVTEIPDYIHFQINEAVTLSRAEVFSNGDYYLNFINKPRFNWDEIKVNETVKEEKEKEEETNTTEKSDNNSSSTSTSNFNSNQNTNSINNTNSSNTNTYSNNNFTNSISNNSVNKEVLSKINNSLSTSSTSKTNENTKTDKTNNDKLPNILPKAGRELSLIFVILLLVNSIVITFLIKLKKINKKSKYII